MLIKSIFNASLVWWIILPLFYSPLVTTGRALILVTYPISLSDFIELIRVEVANWVAQVWVCPLLRML